MIRSPQLRLIVSLLLLTCAGPAAASPPEVFRTFMPDAAPSAFGVVVSPELALCYDSLRGGVTRIWRGTLDLAPTLRAKINQPVGIKGPVFYQEALFQPVRLEPDKVPERRFKGYRYSKDAVTFEYTLDGIAVSETIRAVDGGLAVERSWKADATLYFHAERQAEAQLILTGATEVSPGVWKGEAASGSVTMAMTIRSKAN